MKHKMYIMAKVAGQNFSEYKGKTVRLSERIPNTVDTVWIGVKKHPEKMNTITTFRDENGNIIERILDFADGFLRNRLYKKRTTDISEKEKVDSTFLKEFKLKKIMLAPYFDILEDYKNSNISKTVLWIPVKYIANHIAKIKDGETIHSQVSITNMEKPTKEIHTFKEFRGKSDKNSEKMLSYEVNSLYNIVKPKNRKTVGVKFPNNDTFLAYRALDIDDTIEPITRKFINERGLKHADIRIFPEYYPKDENEKLFGAHFNPEDGTINYNIKYRPSSKTRLVGTAAHETEHGRQYFLKSLMGEAVTDWEYDMYKKFGPIIDEKLEKEAEKYVRDIENYVPLTKELVDGGNINSYRESKLEEHANKIGAKARKRYDKEGALIRKSFPHIPEKFI